MHFIQSLLAVLNKAANGPVISFLHGIREKAGRKLPVAAMIMKALAAQSLPLTGIITAITLFQVFLDVRTFFTHEIIGSHINITPYPRIETSEKCPLFAQSLGQAQISILEIFHIFLRLKFSPSLTLTKIEHFSKVSIPVFPGPVFVPQKVTK